MQLRTHFLIHVAVTAFAAMTSVVSGQDPVPMITGPVVARTGDIVILDASGSTADHFDWLVDTSGVLFPSRESKATTAEIAKLRAKGFDIKPLARTPPAFMIMGDGKKLLLASYPGIWKISLAVGNENGVKQLPWIIVITNNGPQPPPGPKPDPPKPDPPGLNTNLTAAARTWLATVPASSRNHKDRKGITIQKNLRDTLHEIGISAVKAGSIAAMETLLQIGIQASFTPLGAKALDWKSFAESANKALDDLKDKGATPAQYGAALISIAKGLE